MSGGKPIGEAELERLQHQSFSYFLHDTNPENGLVIDKTAPVERTLTTLRLFWNSPQGPEPDATGYHGSASSPILTINGVSPSDKRPDREEKTQV